MTAPLSGERRTACADHDLALAARHSRALVGVGVRWARCRLPFNAPVATLGARGEHAHPPEGGSANASRRRRRSHLFRQVWAEQRCRFHGYTPLSATSPGAPSIIAHEPSADLARRACHAHRLEGDESLALAASMRSMFRMGAAAATSDVADAAARANGPHQSQAPDPHRRPPNRPETPDDPETRHAATQIRPPARLGPPKPADRRQSARPRARSTLRCALGATTGRAFPLGARPKECEARPHLLIE